MAEVQPNPVVMSFGAALNAAGRLVRVLDRLSQREAEDSIVGRLGWIHLLRASGSIHSHPYVQPGGALPPPDGQEEAVRREQDRRIAEASEEGGQ